MDQQIRKLQKYLNKYLGKTKNQILAEWGIPQTISDGNMWFYTRRQFLVFKDEICFLFSGDKVEDIVITEYIIGIPQHNIFFNKDQEPSIIISPVKF